MSLIPRINRGEEIIRDCSTDCCIQICCLIRHLLNRCSLYSVHNTMQQGHTEQLNGEKIIKKKRSDGNELLARIIRIGKNLMMVTVEKKIVQTFNIEFPYNRLLRLICYSSLYIDPLFGWLMMGNG